MKLRYLLLITIVFLLLGCEEQKTKPKVKQDEVREVFSNQLEDTPPNPEIVALRKRYTKMDERLKAYKDAKYWFKNAYKDRAYSYNLGLLYLKYIKDYKEAWYWYRTSWNIEPNYQTAQNLGYLHEKLNEKEKALDWYLKSWNRKETGLVANNIGFLYMEQFKDDKKALEWYKLALEKEETQVFSNLAAFYHEKNENIKAAAYTIAHLAYVKKEDLNIAKEGTLKFLREEFKLDDETIQKGLEFQKNIKELEFHYWGELFDKK